MAESLPKVIDLMVAAPMAFALQTLGEWRAIGHNIPTQLTPGPRLEALIALRGITLDDIGREPGEEVVVLKSPKDDDGAAELLDYDDTEQTHAYRTQMRRVNEWLASLDIAHYGDGVDVRDRHLVRRFTCGRFDSGGRLWGGWWMNLPKQQRVNMTELNGGPVISLDHSAMGVRIVYGLARKAMPEGDAYAAPGVNLQRDTLKRLMSACLFSERQFTRWPSSLAEESNGVPVAKAIDALRARHPAIAHLMFTGIGHKAQHIESNIMLDTLFGMMDAGIPALPVHDALVVPVRTAGDALGVMKGAFQARVWGGVLPHIHVDDA